MLEKGSERHPLLMEKRFWTAEISLGYEDRWNMKGSRLHVLLQSQLFRLWDAGFPRTGGMQTGCWTFPQFFFFSSLLPSLKLALLSRILCVFFIHPTQHVSLCGLSWNQLLLDTGSNITIFHMGSSKPFHECAFNLLVWAEPGSSVIYLQRRLLLKAGQGSQDLVKAR